jgi:hypothetical protein
MRNNDADWGIEHIQRLLALAESLRALRISVYHHEWYELTMGSWKLTAGTRHRSYEFVWDGHEGVMSVRDHFTQLKAVLARHPQSLMRSLVFPLRLTRFTMSSAFSRHAQTPNKSLQPTADRSDV